MHHKQSQGLRFIKPMNVYAEYKKTRRRIIYTVRLQWLLSFSLQLLPNETVCQRYYRRLFYVGVWSSIVEHQRTYRCFKIYRSIFITFSLSTLGQSSRLLSRKWSADNQIAIDVSKSIYFVSLSCGNPLFFASF